jgi:hypothetical protein
MCKYVKTSLMLKSIFDFCVAQKFQKIVDFNCLQYKVLFSSFEN